MGSPSQDSGVEGIHTHTHYTHTHSQHGLKTHTLCWPPCHSSCHPHRVWTQVPPVLQPHGRQLRRSILPRGQSDSSQYLKECPVEDGKEFFCRKIYQNVRGVERVIRSCGWEKQSKPCYSTVLEEYNTYVCMCDDRDGCNSASMFSISS